MWTSIEPNAFHQKEHVNLCERNALHASDIVSIES